MADVRKIKPNWELVERDKNGDLLFDFTEIPLQDLKEKKAASEKVMKEMENRQKL